MSARGLLPRPSLPLASLALASSLALAGALAACSGSESDAGGGPPFEDGGDEKSHVAGAQTCFAPAGLENPKTIADVVAILNALPRPVSVGCFLQTLPRPLVIEASSDQSSFQPAYGPASPRVLLHIGDLVVTVVPAGTGSSVIEMSEKREEGFSTKAELPFPITVDILPGDPYLRVQDSANASECSVCHINETRDTSIEFESAYKSKVLHPLPQYLVPLDKFVKQYGWCDPEMEAPRCEILDGIFGYGDVVEYTQP